MIFHTLTHGSFPRTTVFVTSRVTPCGHPNTVVYAVGFSAAFYFTFPRAAFCLPRTVFYVTGCFSLCRLWTPRGPHIFPPHTTPASLSHRPPCHHQCWHVVCVPFELLRRRPAATTTEDRYAVPCAPPGVPPYVFWESTRCVKDLPPNVWCPHDDAVVVHTTRWRGSKSTPVISILQIKSLTLFLVRTFCRIRGLYGLQD